MNRHQQTGMELIDYVNELTRTHTHREHYNRRANGTNYGLDHVTEVPPLLHQLRYASPSGLGDERASGGYESRPAVSLDALDTLTRIEHAASTWLTTHTPPGVRMPRDLDAVLQRLAGLHAGMPSCGRPHGRRPTDATGGDWCCTRHHLEYDVRRWWAQARVVTGWDSAAWRPDNTCPMCGEHGSLRVRLAEKVGLCVECRETWGEDNIGLLADHIREESAAERPPLEATRCWCPWPAQPFTFAAGRWGVLCPSCGTRTCHRASQSGRISA